MKPKLFIVLFAVLIATSSYSQDKYAVLLTGCKPAFGPLDDQIPLDLHPYDEFWNDTFLMWELLTKVHGFIDARVKVLFYNGNDWSDPNPLNTNNRYKASRYGLERITDHPADTNTIVQVLTDLKNQLTEKDFLFVWTFGHGSYEGSQSGHGLLRAFDPSNPSNQNLYMKDERLGYLINSITAKKVVWMAQCYGGNFSDDINTGDNCYFLSAGSIGETTHPAEDICPQNFKNERYPTSSNPIDTCYHGEFNFHLYSSSNGSAPSYSLFHGDATFCPNIYAQFSAADQNLDVS